MHLTSSVSFRYTINSVSLYVLVSRHPMPELRTSSFPLLPPLLHPRNKSSCVLQPYWKRLEVFLKKNCSRGEKKEKKTETRRYQGPPLLTPEKQWPMGRTTHHAYTARERNSHAHIQNAFKSSYPDVSAQLHVSNVLWAECNRPNKAVLLCRTSAGK